MKDEIWHRLRLNGERRELPTFRSSPKGLEAEANISGNASFIIYYRRLKVHDEEIMWTRKHV